MQVNIEYIRIQNGPESAWFMTNTYAKLSFVWVVERCPSLSFRAIDEGSHMRRRSKATSSNEVGMSGVIARNAVAFALLAGATPLSAFAATCTVPNSIANGQVADASKVMENFEAVADCAEQAVTTTGIPTTGSVAVISGPGTVTSGNLTGDVTTSGSTVTSLSNSGVAPGSYTSANITVDTKGRVVAATSGAGSQGEWADLTFGTSATTRWGFSYWKADQTQNLSYGKRLEVVIGFKRNAGQVAGIAISPDGNTSYASSQQSDNNWVLYRYASNSSPSTLLSGGSMYHNVSSVVEISMTIFVGKSGSNNIVETERWSFDKKISADAYENVPLISGSAGIYIALPGDDMGNLAYARYRIM